MLHLHEPFAPGASKTAMFLHPAPIVATFHAAGESTSYRLLTAPLRRLAENLAHRVVVSKDALALIEGAIGGEYEVLFNGVELDVFEHASPHVVDRADDLLLWSARGTQGSRRAARRDGPPAAEVRLLIGSNGPDTKRLQQHYAADPRIEWLGRLTDEEKIALPQGSDAVLRAVAAR